MEELRELCGALGFSGVTSYLQTGNLLFEWDGAAEVARDALEGALVERGLKNCSAMVWPLAELEAFVASEPFARHPAGEFRQYVTLYREELPEGVAAAVRSAENTVVFDGRIHCSAYPLGTSTVDVMNSPLTKLIKVPGTTRYWHVLTGFLGGA
jgi:uncharacterized protein (DUF1697 family)